MPRLSLLTIHRPDRLLRLSTRLVLASALLIGAWLAQPDLALAAPDPAASPAALVVRDQAPPPDPPPATPPRQRDIEGGITRLFNQVATVGVNIVGAVFTAVAVIGGLLIITAGSNGRRSEMGQAFLWSGVIGVFIVLMAATFAEELVTLFGG
jgi:hypothetical protein